MFVHVLSHVFFKPCIVLFVAFEEVTKHSNFLDLTWPVSAKATLMNKAEEGLKGGGGISLSD